jgi:segregation and condensation protein B
MTQSTTSAEDAGPVQPALVAEPAVTPADVSGALEALLLLAEEPQRSDDLAAALGAPEPVVRQALADLVTFYDETGRGFELREVGGGWRYYTREEHAELIAASVLEGQQSRLSQAALETLAVIAYSQPISRGRVSAVRGVSVDGVIRTLLARGLIEEAGHDVDSGAVVFATTSYFLERMGLRSLDDLPALAPHLPEAATLEAELGQLAAASAPGRSRPDHTDEQEPDEHDSDRATTAPVRATQDRDEDIT